jgi:hypothetical protein
MADTDTVVATTEPEPSAWRSLYDRTPWWGKVLVIFLASRIVTTIILLVFAQMQLANPWTGAHPDYFSFSGLWDSTWYHIIGTSGYPSVLPHTTDGHIDQSAWAFLPAYPFLVALFAAPFGRAALDGNGFFVAGDFVSVAFAAGAALMFYRLLVRQLGASSALFSVVLFCFAPLSAIFQVSYAESMQVFLLMCVLWFLQQRRYWTMLPFIALVSFTRPTGLAIALMMAGHVIYRWVGRKRDPFPVAERVASVVVGIASALLGYAWPWIAGLVTGVPNAYTATELAWRQPYIGWVNLVPFQPWIQGAEWWVTEWWGANSVLAIALLVVVVALFAALMFTPWVKKIGVDLRLWVASWAIYLLAVFFPQSSTFRLLIPAFPLLGALSVPRSRWFRIGLVGLFIVGQIGWIYIAWWSDGYDWTPP